MTAKYRLTIGLNLKNNAPFQWNGFNYNAFAVLNGIPIATNEDGLYSLFDADNDDDTDIDAFFELITTDFGTPASKRLRILVFSAEVSGDLNVKTTTDDDEERTYLIRAKRIGQKQHRMYRVSCRRDQKGVYWMLRIENKGGCDFSIDGIDAKLIMLGTGR